MRDFSPCLHPFARVLSKLVIYIFDFSMRHFPSFYTPFPTFLSPPVLRTTSPFQKGRHEKGGDTSPATPWLPCAKGAVSQRLTEGLYGVSLNFSEKKFNESLRKDYTGKTPAARRAADCRFLSSLACGSFHLVSVFHKGKKSITSDALFADLYPRFDLFYRNPAFLSPPSRSARHLPRHTLAPLCKGSCQPTAD